MIILKIALKDLKLIFIRDKKSLLVLLLMPIILIMIIGSALTKSFTQDTLIKKFTIGIVNNDNGELSSIFVNKILRENMSSMVDTFYVNETKANTMLKNKTAPVIIYIPQNFTQDIHNNVHTKITLKSNLNNKLQSTIIETVTKNYTDNISSNFAAVNAIKDSLKNNNIPPQESSNENNMMLELQKKTSNDLLKFQETNRERSKSVSSMQYYSAGLMIMFLLFGAIQGSRLIVDEREKRTLSRIMYAIPSKFHLIVGKLLGLFLLCLTQVVILIVATSILFNVSWGNIVPLILVTCCTVFTAASLGIAIASIAKTAKAADSIGSIVVWLFSVIGGGMIPIFIMPNILKQLSKITLNNWATSAYIDLMMGSSISHILPNCLILLVMGLIYLTIGIIRFKVQEGN